MFIRGGVRQHLLFFTVSNRRKVVMDMGDAALLMLRATVGALLAGHGAQKLFGWFEGPHLGGFAGALEMMGLRPGRPWALLGGVCEFGGGLLTALGFLNPVGPLGIIAAMGMATVKAHWGKPIWATKGGAELPVTNIAAATAAALVGPGAYSLDQLLGIRLPRSLFFPGLGAIAGVLAFVSWLGRRPQGEAQQAAIEEAQSGEEPTETVSGKQ